MLIRPTTGLGSLDKALAYVLREPIKLRDLVEPPPAYQPLFLQQRPGQLFATCDRRNPRRPGTPPLSVVVQRCDNTCVYCYRTGQSLGHDPDGHAWHREHAFPVALGGRCNYWNTVLACRACNLAKGTRIWYPGERIGYYGDPVRLF